MGSYAVTLGGPAEHVREFESMAEARKWAELQLATHPGHEVRWSGSSACVYNQFGVCIEHRVAEVRRVAA